MNNTYRRNIVYLILWNGALIVLILLIQNKTFGQYHKPPGFFSKLAKDWSVGVNGGRTSFFGDVSLYDEEYNEKISKEGSWAYGFTISKQLTPIFGLSGQLLMGKLAGSSSKGEFVSNITEYSGSITLNLVNLLIPDNNARFVPYFTLGLGQFTYDTRLKYYDPDIADVTTASEEPELIYIFGGGVYYIISNSFNVTCEFTGRRMDNDKIDGSTSNKKDDDYFSYISVGMTYKINNTPRDTRYYKRMGMKSPLIRRSRK